MLAHLSFYLCFLGLILSAYSVFSACLALSSKGASFQISSRRSLDLSSLSLLLAALAFWWMLYSRDYSVEYIYKNSSDDLPPFYTLSALWSSLEGSHFFWALILGVMVTIAQNSLRDSLRALAPYLSIVLGAVMVWMFLLLITFSDPFWKIYPPPAQGLGMNSLLQNPYMAFHPPTLFMGYSALVVPYAYSMAALFIGSFPSGWVAVMRRWSLAAWVFLTIGIALGGRWAYVELGWGGYWAWDPVENSSLVPWLLSTALVHGLSIQKKMSVLGGVNIMLSILAFFFSFFGTFITRSGLITSVHSFAQSDVGEVYLIFLALLLAASVGLFIWRFPECQKTQSLKTWNFSRELMMISGMFFLCVFAVTVVIGTLYPIASEILGGVRVNVQAPYFHAFAPWVGAGLAALMAWGAVLRYHSQRVVITKSAFLKIFLLAGVSTGVFSYLAGVGRSTGFAFAMQVVGSFLVFFTFFCLMADLYVRFRKFSHSGWAFFKRNASYVGGVVAHVGFLIALLGFLGNYRSMERTVSLEPGVAQEVLGYTLEYQGLDITREDNATLFRAALSVSQYGEFLGMMSPARSRYPTSEELLHEVAVKEGFWQDLYLVLTTPPQGEGDNVVIQVYVNPLVKLVWIAVLVMVLGGGLTWWSRRGEAFSKP